MKKFIAFVSIGLVLCLALWQVALPCLARQFFPLLSEPFEYKSVALDGYGLQFSDIKGQLQGMQVAAPAMTVKFPLPFLSKMRVKIHAPTVALKLEKKQTPLEHLRKLSRAKLYLHDMHLEEGTLLLDEAPLSFDAHLGHVGRISISSKQGALLECYWEKGEKDLSIEVQAREFSLCHAKGVLSAGILQSLGGKVSGFFRWNGRESDYALSVKEGFLAFGDYKGEVQHLCIKKGRHHPLVVLDKVDLQLQNTRFTIGGYLDETLALKGKVNQRPFCWQGRWKEQLESRAYFLDKPAEALSVKAFGSKRRAELSALLSIAWKGGEFLGKARGPLHKMDVCADVAFLEKTKASPENIQIKGVFASPLHLSMAMILSYPSGSEDTIHLETKERRIHGKALSCDTLNWAAKLLGTQGSAIGSYSIDGRWDREKLTIDFSTQDGCFITNAVKAKLAKSFTHTLHTTFAENKWKGKIAIDRLCLQKHPLHFCGGNLVIDGSFVRGEDFKLEDQAIDVRGGFALDLSTVELHLDICRISGSMHSAIATLGHFIPIPDYLQGASGQVCAQDGGVSIKLSLINNAFVSGGIDLTFHGANFNYRNLQFSNAKGKFHWDNASFGVHGLEADLGLGDQLLCTCAVPSLVYDEEKPSSFAAYLTQGTETLAHFFGTTFCDRKAQTVSVSLDEARSVFLGSPCSLDAFCVDFGGKLLACKGNFSFDLGRNSSHLEQLRAFVPKLPSFSSSLQGALECCFHFLQETETFHCSITSPSVSCKETLLHALDVEGVYRQREKLWQWRFGIGDIRAELVGLYEQSQWTIPSFFLEWRDIKIVGHGEYKTAWRFSYEIEGQFQSLWAYLGIDPEKIDQLEGTFSGQGVIDLNWDLQKKWCVHGHLTQFQGYIGPDHLKLQVQPITLSLCNQVLSVTGIDCSIFNASQTTLLLNLHMPSLSKVSHDYFGQKGRLFIAPEIVHWIGQTHLLPHLSVKERQIKIKGLSLPWENQLDIAFDFSYQERKFFFDANVKEGYFWLFGQTFYLQDMLCHVSESSAKLRWTSVLNQAPFSCDLQIDASPSFFQGKLAVSSPEAGALKMEGRFDKREGLSLGKIEGELYGIAASLSQTLNPRQHTFVGQLRFCSHRFLPMLFAKNHQLAEWMHLSGLEWSGELRFPKNHWEEWHLEGLLKGKSIECGKWQVDSFLGGVKANRSQISLHQCFLSDESGTVEIESLNIQRMRNDWKITIPEIWVRDFRPSLLKEKGKERLFIRPFKVDEMCISNISGYLHQREKWTGSGYCRFINTFHKNTHVLDLPIEILGRLGLDPVLLVPVQGELHFLASCGKVMLTDLRNSYSEGQRSYFYLSRKEPSYIDFKGQMYVNIKMKQYVLLKVTQPFTLSIQGSIKRPSYTLR